MNGIPETPNTQNEPLMTIAEAIACLPGQPRFEPGVLMRLGKDASTAARAMGRPTGQTQVYGKRWAYEKSYTFDVLRRTFELNPDTAPYLRQAVQS